MMLLKGGLGIAMLLFAIMAKYWLHDKFLKIGLVFGKL